MEVFAFVEGFKEYYGRKVRRVISKGYRGELKNLVPVSLSLKPMLPERSCAFKHPVY